MKKSNTPIVVATEQWPLPDSLIKDVQEERMISSLLDFGCPGKLSIEDQVGDAEIVAYMMPASQAYPLNSEDTELYLYCASNLLRRKGMEVPKEIEVKELSEYQQGRLKELKGKIYATRGGKEKNPVINALSEVFRE